jgi:hypothetical protein
VIAKVSKKQLFLDLLRKRGRYGVTTRELLEAGCGSRYGARLAELRDDGHVVTGVRLRNGSWRYTLIRDAERDQASASRPPGAASDDLDTSLEASGDDAAHLQPDGHARAASSPTLFDPAPDCAPAPAEQQGGARCAIYDYDPED